MHVGLGEKARAAAGEPHRPGTKLWRKTHFFPFQPDSSLGLGFWISLFSWFALWFLSFSSLGLYLTLPVAFMVRRIAHFPSRGCLMT